MRVYQREGLVPLEIWHGMAGRASLYELRADPNVYFRGLFSFLADLHAGRAVTADPADQSSLEAAAGFHRAVFMGGGASEPGLAVASGELNLPFDCEIRPGVFSSRSGAETIFSEMQWRRGVALDVGQTQVKLIAAEGDRIAPRDERLLPYGAYSLEAGQGRTRLRAWLQSILDSVEEYDGAVLALPNAISSTGEARAATYPGLYGDVAEIFSGLFRSECIVLNDACLAACGVTPEPRTKTLVVTLGFGVGGALWLGR